MTENDFNAELSKHLRKMTPEVHYIKASDKFTVGISDFLLWHKGTCAAVESKYVREWPRPSANLLKHAFTGPQVTFLESVALTKNKAYGLIGVGEEQKMYLVNWVQIPPSGNWTTRQFIEMQFTTFAIKDVDGLVRWIFNE